LEQYYNKTTFEGCNEFLAKKDHSKYVIAGEAHRAFEGDLAWSLKNIHATAVTRLMAYVLRKVFRKIFHSVTVNIPSFPKEDPEHSYVIIPTHRSYFDFLLCSYVLFDRDELNIKLPFIAGTEDFFKIPVINWLFRNAQCFPIRRGLGKEDIELTQVVHNLVDNKENLKFFVEGTRSRSRQFLTPKRGLLKCIQNSGKTFTLLPVSISYEKIAEEEAFYNEIRTGVKSKMGLWPLVRWSIKMIAGKINLGNVHVQAGNLIKLAADSDLNQVLPMVMSELQKNKVATDYHEISHEDIILNIPNFHETTLDQEQQQKHFLQQWCHQNQWIYHLFPLAQSSNPWIAHYINTYNYLATDPAPCQNSEEALKNYFRPLLVDAYQICQYIDKRKTFSREAIIENCSLFLGTISSDFTLSFLTEQGVIQSLNRKKYEKISVIEESILQDIKPDSSENIRLRA